ncbi:MAG: XRE family transcriptional regulator [Actinobacteria bacterium]|nr:XRE family transcriptional regulator [Actinomycetota bacterium]
MKLMQHMREERGLSRRKVAQLADMDPALYGKVESGRVLSGNQLERLARALGYKGDPAALLEELNDARD